MNKNTASGNVSNFDSVKSHNHKIAENSTTVEAEVGIILILDFFVLSFTKLKTVKFNFIKLATNF
jgi:hypothetical protein